MNVVVGSQNGGTRIFCKKKTIDTLIAITENVGGAILSADHRNIYFFLTFNQGVV